MTMQLKTHFGHPGDFLTVRHLTIHGSNFDIGRTLGTLAIDRHDRKPADLAAPPLYVRARRAYVQRHYPIHWQRMRGVAAAFGLDPDDDRYDLSGLDHLVELPGPFACSAVYYPPATTVTGAGYLSRNYDFAVGSMAEVLHVPVSADAAKDLAPVMSEPYIMEWYPADGGYASIAIHAFDTLAGTLDGINSAGLVVSILADHDAINELGPKLEIHAGPQRVVGLHELQVMRFLLDTCATADEARDALMTVKQYYHFVPCHYLVADRDGHSFVYENSTGRNIQYVIEGGGQPQVVTNFQLSKHPTLDTMPDGDLTLENEAYWRYRTLLGRVRDHRGAFAIPEIKASNDCVNVAEVLATTLPDDPIRSVPSRTIWHSLYDQRAGTFEASFYLGEDILPDGTLRQRRSEYLNIALER